MKPTNLKALLLVGASILAATNLWAGEFSIDGGDLRSALSAYAAQTGISLMVSDQAIKGIRSTGVHGSLSNEDALSKILSGTGFVAEQHSGGVAVVRAPEHQSDLVPANSFQLAQASSQRAAIETVTVTSSKLGGADVQSIPIAITALSQEQLTATQTAGGPDLVKQVPNLTFTKTNFTGYSIQIRGIGTQAISVTTDPAVAVAFNDVPFIRNHFFEQEFFDLGQVEVLRGPQGTLYGRNATAGVVNLIPAKPTDQFEAMASGELGNYHQRRFEGMINLPIVDDRLDVRVAGEWTKRQGYSFNEITDQRIDGRDLWSGRVSIRWKPTEAIEANLVWEHFSENDDRLRSSKQICKTAPIPTIIDGVPVPQAAGDIFSGSSYLSQGCLPTSFYSADAFKVPNGFTLGYYGPLTNLSVPIRQDVDPYANATQSQNLRVIESSFDPKYKAKNDLVELNTDYSVTPNLKFTSQTGFGNDFLWGTQDYNRFNTRPGTFVPDGESLVPIGGNIVSPEGVFCDPQLGCSDRLVAQDLSTAKSWQLSQEFRLSSNFSGPLNFSVGGNYLHYETFEKYYVFINTISLYAIAFERYVGAPYEGIPYVPGVTDNLGCFGQGRKYGKPGEVGLYGCVYVDPNPIGSVNDDGHNYFLSQNPYTLNSYATFGEVYYDILPNLKLTGGLRWTEDRKHFTQIPSWFAAPSSWGYPITGVIDQQWGQWTGRFNASWTPKLTFSDQTLVYASFSHGYKAGGANPPGAVFLDAQPSPIHPLTFKPEFVNAFELGTKNTLLDGTITLNTSGFFYDYTGYQVSEIVDRTAINQNFDATVKGVELEATWEPLPGMRFNFGGGWEHTRIDDGQSSVDLMDRTAGHTDWMVVKPFVSMASNCILPTYVVAAAVKQGTAGIGDFNNGQCGDAYLYHFDPLTGLQYVPNPTQTANAFQTIPPGYPGFDPSTAPNGGNGFSKDLSGNELPNAPPFTVSAGAQYTMPLSQSWAGTARADFYWQDGSWWRVFNDMAYDRLRGYSNLNLALIFTHQDGWQVMLFDKNVFNTTAITGAFLNSDDTALTTNVFLTDPKLIGIRVTKNW